jgi:hypothetical protein
MICWSARQSDSSAAMRLRNLLRVELDASEDEIAVAMASARCCIAIVVGRGDRALSEAALDALRDVTYCALPARSRADELVGYAVERMLAEFNAAEAAKRLGPGATA